MVNVLLNGVKIAELSTVKNRIAFQYKDTNGFCPSPFELPFEKYQHKKFVSTNELFNFLPGVIYDSLPDDYGRDILKKILGENVGELERLMFLGKSAMGALEYQPEKTMKYKSDVDAILSEKEFITLSKEIDTGEFSQERLSFFFKNQASAGGARSKALVSISEDKKLFSAYKKDSFTPFLIKFDGFNQKNESQDYCAIEHIYHVMAKESGINTAETDVLFIDNYRHFITKRFDRDTQQNKIHMASFSGLLGISHKTAGVADYLDLLRATLSLTKNKEDVLQLFTIMIFNVIARNQDDHTKNFSMLMDTKTGKWSLSPAYDLTYSNGQNWTAKHQCLVNGKEQSKDITTQDFYDIGSYYDIDKATIDGIINNIQTVLLTFDDKAKQYGVSPERIKRIKDSFHFFKPENKLLMSYKG